VLFDLFVRFAVDLVAVVAKDARATLPTLGRAKMTRHKFVLTALAVIDAAVRVGRRVILRLRFVLAHRRCRVVHCVLADQRAAELLPQLPSPNRRRRRQHPRPQPRPAVATAR
jgi:hypothetical protein